MEYESVILKRLIDTYGVVGNPRYISEIIKEFIVQGKERFPELFTYQADWLAHIDEFGLNPSYTVSYTGQSIYAPNTLEKPVKSAILSGSTKYRDIDTGEFLETFEEGRNLELVSVKMPVLTTTGKNLFDVRSIDNAEYDGAYRYVKIPIKRNTTYTLSLDKTLSFGYVNIAYGTTPWGGGGFEWVCHPEVVQKDVMTFTNTIYDFLYINWAENNEDLPGEKYVGVFRTIQLEEGTQATPYEPFKSNILTVNEDVTMRSNGNVYDELDLLTGKLIQHIDEDGSVLTQEVVKTVDLTILDQNGQNVKQLMSFNGGTHFNTGSLEGSPLPSVAVTVETDLEETLRVCSLDGNTM